MALSYATGPTTLSLTLTDTEGRTSVKEFVVPTAVWDPASDLLSALVTIRDALVGVYNAVTKTLITNVQITIKQAESATLPAGETFITDIASVITNLSGGEGKNATVSIPGPADVIMVDTTGKNRGVVDITSTELLAFIAKYQLTGNNFTLSDGETVDDTTPLKSGKRISRKSSRAL